MEEARDKLGRLVFITTCKKCGIEIKVRDKDEQFCKNHRKYSSRSYVPHPRPKMSDEERKERRRLSGKIYRERIGITPRQVRIKEEKKQTTSSITRYKTATRIITKPTYKPTMRFCLVLDARTKLFFDSEEKMNERKKMLNLL